MPHFAEYQRFFLLYLVLGVSQAKNGFEVFPTCEAALLDSQLGGGWRPMNLGDTNEAASLTIPVANVSASPTPPPSPCFFSVALESKSAWLTVKATDHGNLGVSTCNSSAVANIIQVWAASCEATSSTSVHPAPPLACGVDSACESGKWTIPSESGMLSSTSSEQLYLIQVIIEPLLSPTNDSATPGTLRVDLEWVGGTTCGDGFCIPGSEACSCEEDCGPIDFNTCARVLSDRRCSSWEAVRTEPGLCPYLVQFERVAWSILALPVWTDSMSVFGDLIVTGPALEDGIGCAQAWEHAACLQAWHPCAPDDPPKPHLPFPRACPDMCDMLASVCPKSWTYLSAIPGQEERAFNCSITPQTAGDVKCLTLPSCPDGYTREATSARCNWDPVGAVGGKSMCRNEICSRHGTCTGLKSPIVIGSPEFERTWPAPSALGVVCRCDSGWGGSPTCSMRDGSLTLMESMGVGSFLALGGVIVGWKRTSQARPRRPMRSGDDESSGNIAEPEPLP